MKHAFLILAHNEFEVLRRLATCLDDERNDIFIHFDKKVTDLPALSTHRAGLYVLEKRVDVRWGAPSMVEAELALFDTALEKAPYQYYHLLSGVDLPIKSQDYIHHFFDEHHGQEFIGYTWTQMPPDFARKVRGWHLFPEDFKKGSQWVSVTEQMARYFVNHRDWIHSIFRNTFCCDELVMQTLAWNSPFRDKLFNTEDDGKGCMRLIGWRCTPDGKQLTLQDWSAADFKQIKASPALFARKFNGRDVAFLDKICELCAPNEV